MALLIVLVLALSCQGCGRFLAAIPRHQEIERPVTAEEIVGRWLATTNSLKSAAADGFVPKSGEEVGITLRSNGTYSFHQIFPQWNEDKRGVGREDEEGRWWIQYSSSNEVGNTLMLRTASNWVSSLRIGLDSQRMVLWKSWRDPDDGIDMVFEKVAGR